MEFTQSRRRQGVAPGRNGRSESGKLRHIPIQFVPIDDIYPSPENHALYRPVDSADPEIVALAQSIAADDVQEPLIVTRDHWIISGHRRHVAAKLRGLDAVPCRVLDFRKDEDHDRFMRLLRECNRQRVKTFDEKLREEIISANPEVAYQSLIEHRETQTCLSFDTIFIRSEKRRCRITGAKRPFLEAIQRIITERKRFWPLSDRQIHYPLLNDPPLIHARKPESLYRNDRRSYQALTEILTRARLADLIRMEVIQDQTRPVVTWRIHADVQGFICTEVDGFAKGYWRDLMQSQPNHVEIVGEKNTIEGIIRPVAMRYCIPYTIGRGFCSLRPRYEIAQRFRKSGKDRLVLLILSDFDPCGEEIAHSFARSLRDDFLIENIEPIKVGLTAEQVDQHNLPPGMEAKKHNKNGDEYRGIAKKFVAQHGTHVWELEALPPETLQDILREAIDGVIDVDAFNRELDQEKADAAKLEGVRRIVLDALRGFDGEAPAA